MHRRSGRPLQGIDERPDLLDVVGDVSDQHHVRFQVRCRQIRRWPAGLDRPDVLDRVVLGDLAETLEHGGRGVESDHRPARRVERPGDRQGEPAGPGTDVEPAIAGSHEVEQDRQDRIVVPGRIRPEERGDRRVEVGPVRDLADPFNLLAVGTHAFGPARLDGTGQVLAGVDVRIVPGDRQLEDEIRVRGQHRPEPAIAGRLRHEVERRLAEQHWIPAAIVGIGRDDHRPFANGRGVHQRPDRRGIHQRLVAEEDQHAVDGRIEGGHPDLEGARQPAPRLRVPDPLLGAPGDRVLDRAGVVPEHHDRLPHTGFGQAIEDVLEQRLAAERREELAAPEARTGAGGEDEGDDPFRHRRIFPPRGHSR